jgi:hypothetical protein
VVPARSLQLLVGTTFLICWGIPKAFLLAPFTLLSPEQMFKIPAHLQVMNKCSLFQNNATFLVSPYRVQSSVSLRIGRECDQNQDH